MSTETLYSHFTDLTHTPRMWGRQSAFTGNIVCTRNTPTHVGKTSPRSSEEQGRGKHPHARGEDRSFRPRPFQGRETPPRTWGRPDLLVKLKDLERNTPTHVGKTGHSVAARNSMPKHPHARGEDDSPVDIGRVPLETPPRTWGRQERVNIRPSSLRNTPTHVGKTGTGGAALLPLQKHPHARGEDLPPWPPMRRWS